MINFAGKPTMPENIEINCEVTRAKVQWTSSFNGGDPQTFTVFAVNGQQSNTISDKGENEIHATYVQNLQSSTTYVFYVSARNSRGFSLSNNISCTTLAGKSFFIGLFYTFIVINAFVDYFRSTESLRLIDFRQWSSVVRCATCDNN